KEFEAIPQEHKLKLIDWLDHTVEDPVRKEVIKLFHVDKEEVDQVTANITKTLQEEKENAIKQRMIESAKKMLDKKVDIQDIVDFTGLTAEEINQLK
ncbi:MAG: hypothetical protein RR490_10540, partial [Niameybacter sp.]